MVRTHLGASDASYDCVFQREDTAGQVSLATSFDFPVKSPPAKPDAAPMSGSVQPTTWSAQLEIPRTALTSQCCPQVGVYLSKELMNIAGRSLKANITTLSPLVLPWSEQMAYAANMFARKVKR